jgi:phage terminase small subunit
MEELSEVPSETQTLTDRQERFVFEYLLDQNASAAAGRAGYSAKSRAAQGSGLLRLPAVRERVRLEMAALLAQAGASVLDLARERKRAGFFRAGKLFDAQGRVLPFGEMDEETRSALWVSVEWRGGEPVIRWRMPNREQALRALERLHEWLERQNEAYWQSLERAAQREARWAGEEARGGVEGAPGPAMVWPKMPWEREAAGGAADGVAPVSTSAAGAAANAEKPQVLSGSGLGQAPERESQPPAAITKAEKHQVLSGSELRNGDGGGMVRPPGAARRAAAKVEKPQVLSGSAARKGEGGGMARPPAAVRRVIQKAEKRPERSSLGGPRVLSGSATPKPARLSVLSAAWAALTRKRPAPQRITRRDPNLLWGIAPKQPPSRSFLKWAGTGFPLSRE